jgi:hypothetical protein
MAAASQSGSNLTFIVAILGILGTLAATLVTQWLTGRRETVRWQRERDHEALRWERERSERQEQWAREDANRWHGERLTAYSKLLVDADSWSRIVRHGVPSANEEMGRLLELRREIGRTMISVQLLTSSDGVMEFSTRAWMDISQIGINDFGRRDSELSDSWKRVERNVLKNMIELEKAMRLELNVERTGTDAKNDAR